MFSIFKIFKKKKIVPHIRLSGIIGSVGRFKQGLNFAGQQEIIEKAFSIKKALAVAISINSPGGSPVQSHLIYSYIRKQAKKNKKKGFSFCGRCCRFRRLFNCLCWRRNLCKFKFNSRIYRSNLFFFWSSRFNKKSRHTKKDLYGW